ncbi:MAG: putative methylase [Archaeoglobaceae archaeon]|nr:putative methylase [Archaeoglobaceae archaeon]
MRAFIEESFPIREVSEISRKEKNIRHGHISTLHIWWARRPLASSRATSYAALIPATNDVEEWEKRKQFIIELAKWENSLNKQIIEKARKDIIQANGKAPKVLDAFAGGGSIPLEALRLGCEVYAVEYNPVAVLILKCTLEYPQRFGKRLVEEVSKWGNWVLEEARRELKDFYPEDEIESNALSLEMENKKETMTPVGYIWARTIRCQNPSCNAEIPLMRQFWLAKKDKKKIALMPFVEGGEVKFRIVGDGYEKMPENFNPEKGTVARAIANCLVCGSTVDDKSVRRLFQQGKSGQRMIAVVLNSKKGKFYRIATEKDIDVYRKAEEYLEYKRAKLMEEWGIDPVPDEPTPEGKGRGAERAFSVRNFGLTTYGDLFNSRQKLALITFAEKVRKAYSKMIAEGYEEEFAKAVVSYLALALSRLTNRMSTLTYWFIPGEKVQPTFSRQALPMVWDYVEINPFNISSGGMSTNLLDMLNALHHLTKVPPHMNALKFLKAGLPG